jgi:hypothetical protein
MKRREIQRIAAISRQKLVAAITTKDFKSVFARYSAQTSMIFATLKFCDALT